jgi:ATP-dependent Clp protease ATP-binding subunit ClpA
MAANSELARTPRFDQIIERASEISRALGNSFVGAEHLFLAIIRDDDAIPSQVLARLTNVQRLDNEVVNLLESPSYRLTQDNT